MNYEDLTEEQKEIWDIAREEGYSDGFDSGQDFGWDEATSNYDSEGYNEGYADGVQAEQDRIQFVLNMMFEAALNMGQGNKAVQYRSVMDLLKPVEIRTVQDDD